MRSVSFQGGYDGIFTQMCQVGIDSSYIVVQIFWLIFVDVENSKFWVKSSAATFWAAVIFGVD